MMMNMKHTQHVIVTLYPIIMDSTCPNPMKLRRHSLIVTIAECVRSMKLVSWSSGIIVGENNIVLDGIAYCTDKNDVLDIMVVYRSVRECVCCHGTRPGPGRSHTECCRCTQCRHCPTITWTSLWTTPPNKRPESIPSDPPMCSPSAASWV